MFDLSAPIIPGKSAAGVSIGQSIGAEINDYSPKALYPYTNGVRYIFESIDLSVTNGRVSQIGVKSGYHGTVQNKIGIGSTIRDVEMMLGKVLENEEDVLVVPTLPGWCFDTELWKNYEIQDNLDSQITSIYVYEAGE